MFSSTYIVETLFIVLIKLRVHVNCNFNWKTRNELVIHCLYI